MELVGAPKDQTLGPQRPGQKRLGRASGMKRTWRNDGVNTVGLTTERFVKAVNIPLLNPCRWSLSRLLVGPPGACTCKMKIQKVIKTRKIRFDSEFKSDSLNVNRNRTSKKTENEQRRREVGQFRGQIVTA